jgi:hypothetical protein
VADRSIVEHALVAGLFDWVNEGGILTIIREDTGVTDPETLDAFVIGVVTVLISEDYMYPTTYGDPWNLEPWDAVRKITARWLDPDSHSAARVYEYTNMELTEKGRVLAEAVALREGWKPPPPGIYG